MLALRMEDIFLATIQPIFQSVLHIIFIYSLRMQMLCGQLTFRWSHKPGFPIRGQSCSRISNHKNRCDGSDGRAAVSKPAHLGSNPAVLVPMRSFVSKLKTQSLHCQTITHLNKKKIKHYNSQKLNVKTKICLVFVRNSKLRLNNCQSKYPTLI